MQAFYLSSGSRGGGVFTVLVVLLVLLFDCICVECYVNVTVGDPHAKPSDLFNASLIQAAINNAPHGLNFPYVILIYPGTFYGQITIDRPFLTLSGSGMNETTIT